MKVSWEQLDACATSDQIANVLRRAGVKGRKRSAMYCPLANATGWMIEGTVRWDKGREEFLTQAEKDFIENFDHDEEFDDLEA